MEKQMNETKYSLKQLKEKCFPNMVAKEKKQWLCDKWGGGCGYWNEGHICTHCGKLKKVTK